MKHSFRGSQRPAVSVAQFSIRNTMVAGSVASPCAFKKTHLTFQLADFLTPPWSARSFGDFSLHKWCVTIDQTGKSRLVLIVTCKLGDKITFTEIFREVGVVYRSISTERYLLAWRTWLGRDEVTKNGKVIGDKIVDGYPCNRGTRRGGDDKIKHITVTFFLTLASDGIA